MMVPQMLVLEDAAHERQIQILCCQERNVVGLYFIAEDHVEQISVAIA